MEITLPSGWFEERYKEIMPLAEKYARAYLKNYPALASEMNDFIDEAFLRLYQHRAQPIVQDHTIPWYLVTLRRLIKHEAKRRGNISVQPFDAAFDDTGLFNESDSIINPVEDAILYQQTRKDIVNAVGKDGAHVFELLHAGYSIKEVAEQFHVTPDCMKMRISRMRAKLRAMLILLIIVIAVTFDRFDAY